MDDTLVNILFRRTRPNDLDLDECCQDHDSEHRRDTIKDRRLWANFRNYEWGPGGPEDN